MPTIFAGRWIHGFGSYMKSTLSLMAITPKAQLRAMILTFWKKHGLQATKDAFSVGRSTLFEWQSRLKNGKGKLHALEPRSRRPHRLRIPMTPQPVIAAVCALRRSFPFLGKMKLHRVLGEQKVTVSASTIGRLIIRFDLPSAPRQYVARQKRKKKSRLPKDHTAMQPGDLVSLDGIVLQEQGRKKYIITALDHATRMAIARVYACLSSRQAGDLLERMQLALGKPVKAVLTDNGSEFHAVFEQACQKEPVILHYWTYPRTPKMNARTERFNRTIQEEARFPPFSASLEEWNTWIRHYILLYNFFRPHQALDYRRPVDQYLSCLHLPEGQSRMWWTHTVASHTTRSRVRSRSLPNRPQYHSRDYSRHWGKWFKSTISCMAGDPCSSV